MYACTHSDMDVRIFCSVYTSDMHIHTYIAYAYSYPLDTGWRRLIGSPKLQIIFHKSATKYRALLRKMTYKDKGSYESWPPCRHISELLLNIHRICMYIYWKCIFIYILEVHIHIYIGSAYSYTSDVQI